MPVSNPALTTVSSKGTYTGNDTANRAIPHGLSRIPSAVLIYVVASENTNRWIDGNNSDAVVSLTADLERAVTAMTDTNFYVGNAAEYSHSANSNAVNYGWVAW